MEYSLNNVFSQFKQTLSGWYKDVVTAGLLVYALPALLIAIAHVIYVMQVGVSMQVSEDIQSVAELIALLQVSAPVIFLSIFGFFITLLYQAGILRSVVSYTGSLSVSDFTRQAVANVLRWLGFAIVIYLLFTVLLIVLLVPVFIVASMIGGLGMFFFVLAVSPFVFAAFVFVAIRLVVSSIVYFTERGVINALKKSWSLTKGRWWKTFGFVLIMYIAFFALALVLLPIMFGLMFVSIVAPVISSFFEPVLTVVLSLFLSPLIIAYLKAVYDVLVASRQAQ